MNQAVSGTGFSSLRKLIEIEDRMTSTLTGKRFAILVENGFEQTELTLPMDALLAAGAEVDIVSPTASAVRGWNHMEWGRLFPVSRNLYESSADDYDGLLLPSIIINPDQLRQSLPAVEFVRGFFASAKPVAAICQGAQLLAVADVVRGRILTSFDSIRIDLRQAGALWLDEPVVVDRGLVTSRSLADLKYFSQAMVGEFSQVHNVAIARE